MRAVAWRAALWPDRALDKRHSGIGKTPLPAMVQTAPLVDLHGGGDADAAWCRRDPQQAASMLGRQASGAKGGPTPQ